MTENKNRNLQDVLNDMDNVQTEEERNALGDEFVEMAAGDAKPAASREHLTRAGRNRG